MRANGVDAALPVWPQTAYEWQDCDPTTNTADYTPAAEHPQLQSTRTTTSPGTTNRPRTTPPPPSATAPCTAATCSTTGSRSSSTEGGVTRASAHPGHGRRRAHRPARRGRAARAAAGAATARRSPTPTAAAAVSKLDAWRDGRRASARRPSAGSKTYANADAVRIMDAWWPLLVQAEFQPGLGTDLYTALTAQPGHVDESPSAAHGPTGAHAAAAFQYGWWSYVDKDIRAVLGEPVQGALTQTYCGGGDAQRLPGRPDQHPEDRRRPSRPPQVYPGDDTLRGRRPVVRRLDRPAHPGRHQARQRSAGRTGRPTSRSSSSPHTGDNW